MYCRAAATAAAAAAPLSATAVAASASTAGGGVTIAVSLLCRTLRRPLLLLLLGLQRAAAVELALGARRDAHTEERVARRAAAG